MTMHRRHFVRVALVALASVLARSRWISPAMAQAYPTRPVRMVVPFAPGGTTDFIGRVIGEKMSELAGQRFFVENKTGASGTIGMKDVGASPPDGYSVLMGDSSMAVTPTLNPAAGMDTLKLFRPVGLVATFPSVLVVHPSVPAKTAAELVAYAKANPGKLNFGSGGNGTVPHLQGEQFRLATNTKIQHVPYRGAAAALQDVVGGQIQMLFTAGPTAGPFIEGGQLRLIATTGAERLPMAAATPTLVESGIDFVSAQWFGLFVPAETPEPIVQRLSELQLGAMRDPAAAKRITEQGGFLKPGSPDDFTRFIEAEIKAWAGVIRAANVTQ
jgi:tripartite-type tricarboxylate transporter receptor subunit TctC